MAYRPKMGSVSSVGSSAAVIEASAADLVLLNQGLGKSKKVSDRLATMLTSFDDVRLLTPRERQTMHADLGSSACSSWKRASRPSTGTRAT